MPDRISIGIFRHLRTGGRTQIRPNKGFAVEQCQSFGEAVELARSFRGFSRYQLAKFMGKTEYVTDQPARWVLLLEQNKVQPTPHDLIKLQTYLGVDFRAAADRLAPKARKI